MIKIIQLAILITSSVTMGWAQVTIVASNSILNIDAPITLDITFDPSVDTALLTIPTGSVDLLSIDANDPNPNDGAVSFTESATTTFTYEVTAAMTGEEPSSATVALIVIDPADSPADNSFTTAIKADSPLFYYRFEEPAGSNYLVDSSGNAHHTDNIVRDLVQGTTPGAMQNAGFFDGNTSIVVPATSVMNESFSFSAIVNIDSLEIAGRQVILAMTDGELVGRNIIQLDNGDFETFIAGSSTRFASTDALSAGGSCLVHFVYNTDPDGNPATDIQTISFYVNGSFRSTLTRVAPVDANIGNWVIGSHKGRAVQHFDGWLDEVALFESALSGTQIAEHADAFFQAADPLLSFTSSRLEIPQGESATLSWKTSDSASVVTLNGTPIAGANDGGLHSMSVSPSSDTVYTIEVDGPGGPFTRTIIVTVIGSATPMITSAATDSAETPNLTIDILANPNTTYNVMASTNLDGPFPEFIAALRTDASGVGSITFETLGEKRFYRIEAQ